MEEFLDNLPFDELIRYLNLGYYLDTFEVGSVKIDPIPWPTTPRKPKQQKPDIVDEILNRPWIDPEKFTGSGFEKSPADDEGKVKKKMGTDLSPTRKGIIMKTSARNHPQSLSKKEESVSSNVKKMVKNRVSVSNCTEKQSDIVDEILSRPWINPAKFTGSGFKKVPADKGIAEKKLGSDLPTIRKTNMITSARNQPQSCSKKEEEDKVSCKVKKMVNNKVCVSNCPKNLKNEEEEKKLEGAKRKLREQYEVIENEKKKRRVQIIDFVKPQPCSPVKKQQRKKPFQMIKSTRKLRPLYLTNSVC